MEIADKEIENLGSITNREVIDIMKKFGDLNGNNTILTTKNGYEIEASKIWNLKKITTVEEKQSLIFDGIGFWRNSGLVNNADYVYATVLCEPNTTYKCKGKSSWEIVPFAILDKNDNILYCPNASGDANEIVIEETITTTSEAYKIVFSAPRTDTVWQNIDSCIKISTIEVTDECDYSLSGIKWGAIGDSFTDPVTLSSQTDTRNYVDLIVEQTDVTAINLGKSGTGYKRNEENNIAFYQRALSVDSDIDVITIFGSGNDQIYTSQEEVGNATDTGTETLAGCVNTTIDNLLSVNSNFKIGIITPTPWAGYAPDNTNATWMKRYSAMIQEVCELRDIPCLDLYNESGLEPWKSEVLAEFYIDDTHLNTKGHKIIAEKIRGFLLEISK